MSGDPVPAYVADAFCKHDDDGSGVLEPQEIPDALSDCALFVDDACLLS